MTSMFRFNKSLEWCTELPSIDCPRKSPVFSVDGNEWFFGVVLQKPSDTWYFGLYLELKCTHAAFKPCRGNVEFVLVKNETIFNNVKFKVLKPKKKMILYVKPETITERLTSDYLVPIWIKFVFCFDTEDVSLSKIKNVEDKLVQTPLYIDTNFLLEGVSKDLSALFDEGLNHDVEFRCGDQSLKAHKNVLSCRSEVFASMLRTEMTEGKTGQVKIQDAEITVFKSFLKYLYTGVLPELMVDTALQMYAIADKYTVSALKKQCASFLLEHLSPENACEILIVSDRHGDADFKKNVMEYVIKKNVPFPGEILTKFCKDNCALAAEVLNSFCQQLHEQKKEDNVK